MKVLRRFARRLTASVFGRRDNDTRVREELAEHIELATEEFVRAGVPVDEARRRARLKVGGTDAIEEGYRDEQRLRWLEDLGKDLRYALRALGRNPGFAAVAILTLALGIGANTALFSIFNSLVLRPLPVRDPGSLVLLANGAWTYPIWEEIERVGGEIFDETAAWSEESFDLSQGGATEMMAGAYVSGSFFDTLGVRAVHGRMLTRADDSPAAPDGPVVVISHRLWQQRFAGATDVIGRSLTLQRVPFTIVGVMPPGFFGVSVGRTADLMMPFAVEPLLRGGDSGLTARAFWWVEVLARMKPGQSTEHATATLRGVQPLIREATMPDWSEAMRAGYLEDPFTLVPAATGTSDLRSRFETPLSAMVIAVGLVLLIACANIASLLLARALARRRELSVRLALGASRWRLARLLFIESLLIAVAGAAMGLMLATWSSALLVQQLSTWRGAPFLDLSLDWHVLAFTLGLACASALVSGVAPVVGLRGVAPGEALRETGRGVAGDSRFAIRGTLVVAQVALSLVLVVAAGLFLRTFTTLSRVPLGFTPEPLLVVDVNLRSAGVAPEHRGALAARLLDAARDVPGVRAAGATALTPVSGVGWNNWVGDAPAPPADRSSMTWLNATTPDWFATMDMPLVAGRDFDASDRSGGALVTIVNETFARRFLPDREPVGQIVHLGGSTRFQVVGVVADAVHGDPRDGMTPTMYLPLAQRPQNFAGVSLTVAAATPEQRAALERSVAAALTDVDPSVAFTFRTFEQLVDATRTQERLIAMLSGFFGGLALLLAGIGLYGIVAHAVRARRTEIGVRMALGAQPAGIVRLVFQRVGVLIAVGVAIGLTASLWAARFVSPLLFQLEARDPATFAGAAVVLVVVGVLAAWVPAWRAARLDPARVLREG